MNYIFYQFWSVLSSVIAVIILYFFHFCFNDFVFWPFSFIFVWILFLALMNGALIYLFFFFPWWMVALMNRMEPWFMIHDCSFDSSVCQIFDLYMAFLLFWKWNMKLNEWKLSLKRASAPYGMFFDWSFHSHLFFDCHFHLKMGIPFLNSHFIPIRRIFHSHFSLEFSRNKWKTNGKQKHF